MAHIWPIGGGKGGSGKSFITSSLGRLSAGLGRRTLVIDLDLGAANLHTLVGVPYPSKSFSDFLYKKVARLDDAIEETPFENLFLISGAQDHFDIANLPYEQKVKILRAITKLDYDAILLDLGAGTSFNTLDFFLASQNGIFITTPEPTSIENVYRLIRSVYFRRIRYCFRISQFKALEEKAIERFGEGAFNRPECIMSVVAQDYPESHRDLRNDFDAFRFRLMVNQLRKRDNTVLGLHICRVIEKHIGLRVEFTGNVSYDDHVHDAVCQRVSFLDRYPYTKTAGELRAASRQIFQPTGRQLMLQCV